MNPTTFCTRTSVRHALAAAVSAAGLGALLACASVQGATIIHRYSFDADVTDTINFADGSLAGNAIIENGAVVLDGNGSYVNLPNDLLSAYPSVSIEAWYTDLGSGNWARIWDFGNSDAGEDSAGTGTSYAFLGLPNGGLNGAYKLTGQAEQVVSLGARPTTGVMHHVVWTSDADAQEAVIYIDGLKARSLSGFTATPVALGSTANDWLGRSQFSGDAYLYGSINEFRIYENALTPLEVALNAAAGPDLASVEPGNLLGINLQAPETMLLKITAPMATMADFQNIADVNISTLSDLVVTSSAPAVVSVVNGNQLVALQVGTAQITAVYQGEIAFQTVMVTNPPTVLVHRYSFDGQSAETVAADTAGDADGAIMGGASLSGAGAVTLDGGSGYVNLPNGIISSLGEISIEAWVTWNGSRNWERLFDFGNSDAGEDLQGAGVTYLFLSPKGGNGVTRFTINKGSGETPVLDGSTIMAAGTETYVAVVYCPSRGVAKLYVDGKLVSSGTATIPLSSIVDNNNWLGRAQWNDPYFTGSINEFRIHSGMLTDLEVAVNRAAGPDTYLEKSGALKALQITPMDAVETGVILTPRVLADYANVSGVEVSSLATLTVADKSIAVVNSDRTVTALGEGTTRLVATYGGISATQAIQVLHVPPTLVHRYSFDEASGETAFDSVSAADGQVIGGAAFDGAGKLTLDGNSGYVNLPNGIISSLDTMSIETWVTWNGGGYWQRIFDFGNSSGGEDAQGGGLTYLFLTPKGGADRVRYAISGGSGETPILDGPAIMATGTETHVVVLYSASLGIAKLYVDGVLASSASGKATISLSNIVDINNWLGRAQFNDPYFNGNYNEFRIYQGLLSPMEIAINKVAGPDKYLTELGEIQSLEIPAIPAMEPGATANATVLGTFANLAGLEVTASAAYAIDNTDIATVDAEGKITAIREGLANLVASYEGMKATQTVEVIHVPSTLVHRYDFEIDAYDSISYADGLLMNNAYIENGAVVLDGVGAYVDLPNNILIDYMEDASSVSIEAWFIDQGSGNWGRIWDFGNSDAGEGAAGSGTSYAFMGVAGDFIRGAYKLTGQSEQGMNLTPRPSTGVLHQVVWTSDAGANLAVIYVDGVKLGANTAVTATPVDLGATVNDWLGRSQYSGDAYFMGSISEFRVYQGILTPLEVAVDAAAGPDQPQLASGTLTKLAFNMADTITLGSPKQALVLADFQNVQNVNISCVPDLVVTSSDPEVISVEGNKLIASGSGTVTITASYQGISVNKNFTVTYPPMVHRYSFSEAPGATITADSVGGADGEVLAGAFVDGSGSVTMSGNGGYVNLPNGIISSLEEMSIETWVTWTGSRYWERIFDFGTSNAGEDKQGSGTTYLFLAPKGGGDATRFTITQGGDQTPILDGPTIMVTGTETYVAVVYSSSSGIAKLYVDGVLVSSGTATIPLSSIVDNNNWLGRSQYNDPYFAGSINEFRIYNGIITDSMIASHYLVGADVVPEATRPTLTMVRNGSQVTIAWPASAGADFQLESSPSLGTSAVWTSAGTATLAAGTYSVVVPATAATQFFRLKQP